MRLHLEALARHKGQGYDELCQQLKKIHLSVMQLETKQWQLKQQLQPMLQEIKLMYRDFHVSACNGLSQIRSHFISGQGIQGRHYLPTMVDETLPDRFFLTSVEHVEQRMQQCIQSVQYFEQQLAARIRVIESSRNFVSGVSSSSSSQLYGQAQRVTPAMLLSIIKQQAHNFVLLSAQVNAVHQSVHDLKTVFLQQRRQVHKDTSNPFESADRREAAERKQNEEKIRLEQQIQAQQSLQKQLQSQGQQQPGQVGATSFGATTTTLTTFGQPTTAGAPTTGGFGLTNTAFGAKPAATPGATGAVTFGQGMSSTLNKPTGATFGLPATTGSSSTTAALDLAIKPATTPSTSFAGFAATHPIPGHMNPNPATPGAFGAPAATTGAAPAFGAPATPGAAVTFGAPATTGNAFGAAAANNAFGSKRGAESFGINPINTAATTGPFGSFGGGSLSVGGKKTKS